ncbi:hypothetical protein OEV82_15635 [Caldibacillus thermolactis]|mgnify:CR=1 FL=1|jgi:hypothetical protein|uniref:YfhE family protein n=1 Tax=Pallidibacillus thermolactis TaxID=251051 RepID=A0ABT2WJG5_9BACI|nr:hypothetical protein [Pallidibacillus thermolactis]MCU9595836.1 hypothetical protein [Pallidibacillus thermolactis]MCU9602628.1 hypothetical protein [Pallidibacillus thermolactis subsp. kokeshiiformis]MED1675036.1 hypothetical protein [Pallidibacillus thermolactis subsp. kokeshiiformis]
MKDQSNKKQTGKASHVEFGIEFGNINANKFMELATDHLSRKTKKNKKQ